MFKIIIVGILTTLATITGVYNYVSLDTLQVGEQEPRFGADITTIQGTDTLKNSRTTINNNFANLNTELASITGTTTISTLTSAPSLAVIGTITTGVWNGTAIPVAYGGTGTTTFSSNQVLLGNGSSGVKVVDGFGTSGQFLTSGGAGTPPTWTTSAIDQTASYNFTGTTFRIKNLHASSTVANPLVLNGISYSFPSGGDTASSTVLSADGSGSLTFNAVTDLVGLDNLIHTSTVEAGLENITTETSLASTTIPANTLGTANAVRLTTSIINFSIGGSNPTLTLKFKYGSCTATAPTIGGTVVSIARGYIEAKIIADGSTGAQEISLDLFATPLGTTGAGVIATTRVLASCTEDSTGDLTLDLTGQLSGASTGRINVDNTLIEVIKQN